MARKRADQLLFEAGLAESREKAKRLVMAGQVHVLERGQKVPVAKPGQQLPEEAELSVAGQDRFVSRGGHKLLTAIETWDIDCADLVCLDAGASTGGFTDCLLQHGARKVYAVDVGTAQLHEKLRADPRVVSLEKTNLRHAPPDLIPEPIDLLVADVSFISLTMILPACMPFLAPHARAVLLVKPQFELERGLVTKGVVRDPELQRRALDHIRAHAESLGFTAQGDVPARITGPKGNQEYLLYLTR
jgi:23S rRNA (cytidine1920-2'-O)/16S rRNA (cytidine1409-2'-O)-methyltransferase